MTISEEKLLGQEPGENRRSGAISSKYFEYEVIYKQVMIEQWQTAVFQNMN